MSTGFDKIGSDTELQSHWIKRIIAIIIDSIILAIVVSIIMIPFGLMVAFGFLGFWYYPFVFPFLVGILSFLYFMFMESYYEGTIGKKILNLKVTTVDGKRVSMDKALIRNISKIFWLFLILDVIIGFATTGDPRQKYTDRIAQTTVTP